MDTKSLDYEVIKTEINISLPNPIINDIGENFQISNKQQTSLICHAKNPQLPNKSLIQKRIAFAKKSKINKKNKIINVKDRHRTNNINQILCLRDNDINDPSQCESLLNTIVTPSSDHSDADLLISLKDIPSFFKLFNEPNIDFNNISKIISHDGNQDKFLVLNDTLRKNDHTYDKNQITLQITDTSLDYKSYGKDQIENTSSPIFSNVVAFDSNNDPSLNYATSNPSNSLSLSKSELFKNTKINEEFEKIYGQQFPVNCKNINGQFYRSRFGSGNKGKCIFYDGNWLTPNEFETLGGRGSCKDWKKSIRISGNRLQSLIGKGILNPHSATCICSVCSENEESESPVRFFMPYKRRKKTISFDQPSLYLGNNEYNGELVKTRTKGDLSSTGAKSLDSNYYSGLASQPNIIKKKSIILTTQNVEIDPTNDGQVEETNVNLIATTNNAEFKGAINSTMDGVNSHNMNRQFLSLPVIGEMEPKLSSYIPPNHDISKTLNSLIWSHIENALDKIINETKILKALLSTIQSNDYSTMDRDTDQKMKALELYQKLNDISSGMFDRSQNSTSASLNTSQINSSGFNPETRNIIPNNSLLNPFSAATVPLLFITPDNLAAPRNYK
ncbi:unnamed protein product [Gordionus sp. m RMFG-2023]|uniref:uncharacterized protein LOC135926652 n=1 Tax=Gordionus sp. m RMFG-2023 TaxID=3053472 RepID=UPI0030E1489A